jgi:hypothetical protein
VFAHVSHVRNRGVDNDVFTAADLTGTGTHPVETTRTGPDLTAAPGGVARSVRSSTGCSAKSASERLRERRGPCLRRPERARERAEVARLIAESRSRGPASQSGAACQSGSTDRHVLRRGSGLLVADAVAEATTVLAAAHVARHGSMPTAGRVRARQCRAPGWSSRASLRAARTLPGLVTTGPPAYRLQHLTGRPRSGGSEWRSAGGVRAAPGDRGCWSSGVWQCGRTRCGLIDVCAGSGAIAAVGADRGAGPGCTPSTGPGRVWNGSPATVLGFRGDGGWPATRPTGRRPGRSRTGRRPDL